MKKDAPKILVFARPCIGDVLLATPLLRGLRQAYPMAVIHVLVPAGCEAVLEGNPDVDRIFPLATHPRLGELLTFLRSIARQYDIGITSSASDRAYAYILLAARRRFAWLRPNDSGGFWKRRVANGVDVDLQRHAVQDILGLGDLLGIERCYQVVPPSSDTACAAVGNLLPDGEPYAVVHVTPGGDFKRWTTTGWAEVADYLSARGLRVVLTGSMSPDEASYVLSVAGNIGGEVLNLAGRTSLAELGALLRGCAVYVGVDTLTSHLAAAVGAPTIVLFGPTSPRRWGPLPRNFHSETPPYDGLRQQQVDNVLVLQGDPCCETCEQGQCRKERDRTAGCPLMLSITPAVVIEAIESILGSRPVATDVAPASYSP